MTAKEIHVDLTVDELVVLCAMVQCELPIGVVEADIHLDADLPQTVRDRLARAAHSTLVARRILISGPSRTEVVDAVTGLIELAAAPALIVSIEIDRDGFQETLFLLAEPDLAVEVSLIGLSTYRFTPFLPRELMRRIARLSGLRPAEIAAPAPALVSRADLNDAQSLALQDAARAAEHLAALGVPPDTAGALAVALADQEALVTVTILHRPNEHQAQGGTLCWIQSGLSGNWLNEEIVGQLPPGPTNCSPEGDQHALQQHALQQQISLRSVATSTILAELSSFLPEVFAGPPAR